MSDRDCKHGRLVRSCEICDLERENYRLRAENDLMFEAIRTAVRNIGLPGEGYPAPVVDAWVILKAVLDHVLHDFEDERPHIDLPGARGVKAKRIRRHDDL